MSWLIDSNVLISSYDETEEQHAASYTLMERAMAGEIPTCIAHQNLLEFIAVVTHPRRVTHPLSLGQALNHVSEYIAGLDLISPGPTTFFTFEGLLRMYPALRERVFDVYLMATALDNGVEEICSWDTQHLGKVTSFVVKTPIEILQNRSPVR